VSDIELLNWNSNSLCGRIVLKGYMYLTDRHICFFAHMPNKEVHPAPPDLDRHINADNRIELGSENWTSKQKGNKD
jgi:hypothetical protein